jgi:DNA-binding GntR family transcriptional regulator
MAPDPKYLALAAEIRRQIAAGELEPSQELPSTRELMQLYGVGHETVRTAMKELSHEGLIVSRGGVARWVAPGPDDPLNPAPPEP